MIDELLELFNNVKLNETKMTEAENQAQLRAYIDQQIIQRIQTISLEQAKASQELTLDFPTPPQINLDQPDRIPDTIKDLKTFSGADGENFSQWKQSVEEELAPYYNNNVKGTSKHRTAVKAVRNKIIGRANDLLANENVPLSWPHISQCLTNHYADRRDLHTLEHQLLTIRQGKSTSIEFYNEVNKYLTIILNKINCIESNPQAIHALNSHYKIKATKAFVNGLNGSLPKFISSSNPPDLPTALHLCKQQEDLGTLNEFTRQFQKPIFQQRPTMQTQQNFQRQQPNFHNTNTRYPNNNFRPHFNNNNFRPQYNNNHNQNRPPLPPRPINRSEPMEIDTNYSRQVNYQNRNGNYRNNPQTNNITETSVEREPQVDFIDRINNLDTYSKLPHMKFLTPKGNVLKFLVDTGADQSYVLPKYIGDPIKNDNKIKVQSVGGTVEVSHHTFLQLFGKDAGKHKFLLLNELVACDGIIGNDILEKTNATINMGQRYMTIDNIKIPLSDNSKLNNIAIHNDKITQDQERKIKEIFNKYKNICIEPNEKLTYTTTVEGEIRTKTDNPIYSKSYPYPCALKNEVEKEIDELLRNNIIQKSRSPYNSPVWIVPKKEDHSGEKKFRMVIDYRKLNKETIADRYPIPEISEVLANMGGNKFFSLIDLKSGFHQIKMKNKDVEKTAFSINNAKYEFLRLPFGLKNAPSIFQRCLDDILREHIGKQCYVYIDDVVIFGRTEEEHLKNLEEVVSTLEKANMKIQTDKCEFMKKEVEFLGYIITENGIKTNTKKTEAVTKLKPPKTIKELRSFLGMTGYYRKFVKDYAKIAKPLSKLLRGEEGHIDKNKSSKVKITLDEDALTSFEELKEALASSEVLIYPDFNSEFELTTDASNYAIGAVLSQKNKPITYISRTLNKTEENYAANEKEMLAIIWALTKLRNYIYGSRRVNIFTDHQPLTYALSYKNSNSKMKRWKSILEEYDYTITYKPGKQNIVADALSRLETGINSLSVATHSDDSSSHNFIPMTNAPINAFKNQLILIHGDKTNYRVEQPFRSYFRHTFIQPNFTKTILIEILKNTLNPNQVNAIKTYEGLINELQMIYKEHFEGYKVRIAQTMLIDASTEEEQKDIIEQTHQRAHRGSVENKAQIIREFYFPSMTRKIKEYTSKCEDCKINKYERHPNKPPIQPSPIPKYPGQIVHIDLIFFGRSHVYLTSMCKLSKYAMVLPLRSRAMVHIKKPLREIIFKFGVPEMLVMDNETSFKGDIIKTMMDELNIECYYTPAGKSEVNGQIERFHSTLREILLLKKKHNQPNQTDVKEAVNLYNYTIHSVTKNRPVDSFHADPLDTSEKQMLLTQENITRLKNKQEYDRRYVNKTKRLKDYKPGDEIFVWTRTFDDKNRVRYRREFVKENNKVTVLTESGKIIHKSKIRN